jgi:rod shape-determining protein MreC
VRDTRESRLLLVLLVAIAFALITVDIRGGEQSPLDPARQGAAAAFGPVESGVAAAVNPVGNAIGAVRDSGLRHDRLRELEAANAGLKEKLAAGARDRARVRELDRVLKTAGAGGYGIKGAEVIGVGASQGFSWTVTIDAGARDGIARDQTVINGDGLVGRVTTVGPSTATVLLANDPDFSVGTRMEKTDELGFATGRGGNRLSVQLLNSKADVDEGDRIVTFGSEDDKPFVPGVPVGRITHVDRSATGLTRTVSVRTFVGFSKLDIVGVVVAPPRKDPRDEVLMPKKPAKPKPAPTVTVTATPGKDGEKGKGGTSQPGASEAPSPGASPGASESPAGADTTPEPGTSATRS